MVTQKETTISIIIPVYNVERYLPMCLESVAQQNLDDYEVILVDDGSTDSSGVICDKWAENHPEFRVVHQENGGLSAARNSGINKAKGRYLYFVDSDDFLVPNSLLGVLEHAMQCDADVAGFNTKSGERENLIKIIGDEDKTKNVTSEVMDGDKYIATHNFLATVWWYIIKREYLLSLNLTFPEGHRLEDGSFTPFILLHANRIIYVDALVYCYVTQQDSIMHSKSWEKNFNMLIDYAFAANNLRNEQDRCKDDMSPKTSDRWMGLANSYLFFGMLKALRLGKPNYMIKHLKSIQLYPFGKLYAEDYPSKKWDLLHWLMSHEYVWRILGVFFKIFPFYKK